MLFCRKCQFDVGFCDFKSFKVANCDFRILLFDVSSEKIATFAA